MSYILKKSLGQHFLKDENVCKQIISELFSHSFNNLLEVGPGGGALTKYLVRNKDINFKAVELDQEKITWLSNHIPGLEEKIISGSILDIAPPFEDQFAIVGNFPYNISSQILFKILDWKPQVQLMVGMFQKEVAERVVARHGSKTYGILSVLVQAFFETEYLFEVHENCFSPPPKVKSAVIRLIPKQEPAKFASEKAFFQLVKTAFNQRRKMLRNSARGLFDPETLQDKIFEKRPEQLSVNDFADLSFRMAAFNQAGS